MIPYFFLCWTIDVLFVNRPIQVCVCVRVCVCVCVCVDNRPTHERVDAGREHVCRCQEWRKSRCGLSLAELVCWCRSACCSTPAAQGLTTRHFIHANTHTRSPRPVCLYLYSVS